MDYQIERSVHIEASLEVVWTALTDHRQFGEWFQVALDQPFEVGQLSTGKMTYPGYEGYPWRARIEKMEENRVFAFSWSHEDQEGDAETRVEFHLQTENNGTLLTVKETGFDGLPEDARLKILRSNEEGWKIQLQNIKEYSEQNHI
ncbi:MAG: vanillate O-demethylase oxidoreductase VanB [Leptospiraceae bacterium]|nr:vanillate O-demethylase oxidoreductase VanB [Leptospiraceae bacterium]